MMPRETTEVILFIAMFVCMFAVLQATAQALATIGTFVMVAVQ